MVFLEGFIIGLGTVIFIGPVFFTLLKISIEHGIKAGLSVALGIIISDIVAAIVSLYGIAPFLSLDENKGILALAGALILIGLGVSYLFSTSHVKEIKFRGGKKLHVLAFIKGFAVNLINPFVITIWIGLASYGTSSFNNSTGVFLTSVLLGVFSIDVIKVLLAQKLKPLLSKRLLRQLHQIIGLILIAFGGKLLVYFWKTLN